MYVSPIQTFKRAVENSVYLFGETPISHPPNTSPNTDRPSGGREVPPGVWWRLLKAVGCLTLMPGPQGAKSVWGGLAAFQGLKSPRSSKHCLWSERKSPERPCRGAAFKHFRKFRQLLSGLFLGWNHSLESGSVLNCSCTFHGHQPACRALRGSSKARQRVREAFPLREVNAALPWGMSLTHSPEEWCELGEARYQLFASGEGIQGETWLFLKRKFFKNEGFFGSRDLLSWVKISNMLEKNNPNIRDVFCSWYFLIME